MNKGFFDILRESINITYSWRKTFIQITLATIFPLSLLFLLGQIQIFEFLLAALIHEEDGSSKTKWIAFLLFKTTYFFFFLFLSLLSTSVVVYTVACFYTTKDVTFVEVMSVVPKVGKRLMVTLTWNFIILSTYNFVTSLVLDSSLGSVEPSMTRYSFFCLLFVIYMTGFLYISVLCHLASVVTVLEEECGIAALIKSDALAKGKMIISMGVFMLLYLCFVLVQLIYQRTFVVVEELFWTRIGGAIVCFLLLSVFTLFGLVVQTVIYFVCKSSYHLQNAERLWLANDVEVCLGEYAPLRSKDDQLVVPLYV